MSLMNRSPGQERDTATPRYDLPMGVTAGVVGCHDPAKAWASARVIACWVLTLLVLAVGTGRSSMAATWPQDDAHEVEAGADPDPRVPAGKLRFAFDGVPWREVIQWLADEAQLGLHVQDLPAGNFTYSDPSDFTLEQAIDRVNLFLLSDGFSLVRSGKLLSVINLSDPRSLEQLDVLAKLVTVDQLDQRNDNEVVKCLFALGEVKVEDAVEELQSLKLMTTPVTFTKTNRLMITDTVSKLKSVREIFQAFEPQGLDNGTVMKNFPLKHVEAEDVLTVARPHLGLATGEMIGIDVSLSADLAGKNIFVTGVEDKVKLIETLIQSLDKPQAGLGGEMLDAELRSHEVKGGNLQTVYDVLQTILAGQNVRISIDESARSIVAMASPQVQKQIAATVSQLEAADAEFEVIPLRNVDPYFVISLLEEMLDLPDPLFDDPEDIDPNAPKIDADPGNKRLFVRGKRYQIDQIKKIIEGLDPATQSDSRLDSVRMFPLFGERAREVLIAAARFWDGANPILLYASLDERRPQAAERVVAEDAAEEGRTEESPAEQGSDASSGGPRRQTMPDVDGKQSEGSQRPQLLTDSQRGQGPLIRCQVTPEGLLLQSDDTEALDRFFEHLRTISGATSKASVKPVVFYLKYSRPGDAIRTLAEMLDGADAAQEDEAGSLVNGYVTGSSSTFLGSLVTSQSGTLTMSYGTLTVVADTRLNRLIAQGTAEDMDRVEAYLKIIDKSDSITSIETYGTSHLIALVHTRASDVAETIREAYAGRIQTGQNQNRATNSPRGQASPRQSPSRAAPADASDGRSEERENRGNRRQEEGEQRPANNAQPRSSGGRGSQPVRDLEPKMTVAVHEPSNSLIITAPDSLFREVEELVKLLDVRSEQAFEVITPATGSLDAIRRAFSAGESGSAAASGTAGGVGTSGRASASPPGTRPSSVPSRTPTPRRPTVRSAPSSRSGF